MRPVGQGVQVIHAVKMLVHVQPRTRVSSVCILSNKLQIVHKYFKTTDVTFVYAVQRKTLLKQFIENTTLNWFIT